MKLFTEAFLDRWEASATSKGKRWEKEAPPLWIAAFHPDWYWPPTERYTVHLYIRQAVFTGLPLVAFMILGWLLPFGLLWFWYRPILQDPKYHKLLVGLLSHEGFYWMPWTVLWLSVLPCLFCLPRFYFWNRRAERLRREPPLPDVPTEAVAVDTGVWPPPPTLTRD